MAETTKRLLQILQDLLRVMEKTAALAGAALVAPVQIDTAVLLHLGKEIMAALQMRLHLTWAGEAEVLELLALVGQEAERRQAMAEMD